MFCKTLALLALHVAAVLAVQPLVIEGSDFVNSNTGNRYQILGIAYQPGGEAGYQPQTGKDPLSDGAVCLRDAALMQKLGVNAIRVYNVSPDINHDECASVFNAVGIYMLIDVNAPFQGESINRQDPESSYNAAYLNRTFAVVEAFKNYPNTLLFFAGNEVINDAPTSAKIPPYMRAVTRDLKNYIAKHSTRSIPVGYSAADYRDTLLDTWNYLQCTTTGDASDPSRVDLFALNSYSWCGDSTFQTSSYNKLISDFQNTSVPVFFSEYGCNQPSPRIFTEVPVLYGPLMTPVMSGGLVYEYSQETSNFGLVNIASNASLQLTSDFDSLQGQYNKLNITAIQGSKATNTTLTPPTCTSSLIQQSGFNNNFTIPSIPSGAQKLIDNGVKSNNVGKMLPVTNTKVSQVVQATNGQVMDLSITILADDESNTPTGQTTSTTPSTTTSAAPAATSTKKSAASTLKLTSCALLTVGFLAAVLL